MNEFWKRLSDREKLAVGVGAAIAGVVIILQLILSPVLGWRAEQAEQRQRAEDLYRLVTQASGSAGIAAGEAGADMSTPILNALTTTTGEFSITVNYRNARGDGAVETNVTAPADKIFDWLRALDKRFGVTVASADIARGAAGEEVQAQLTLVRRAAR